MQCYNNDVTIQTLKLRPYFLEIIYLNFRSETTPPYKCNPALCLSMTPSMTFKLAVMDQGHL